MKSLEYRGYFAGFLSLGALILLVGFGSGCAGLRPAAPSWVADPLLLNRQYPRMRYLVGYGLASGVGPGDILARREAENEAMADIAAAIEVSIHSVTELAETEVVRNGTPFTQTVLHQSTRRAVMGILSGTEIAETYFDPHTLTWHAIALLERSRTDRVVQDKIKARLEDGRRTLAALPGRPLADFLALRKLESRTADLEWLLVAANLFAPQHAAEARARTTAFKLDLHGRLGQIGRRLRPSLVLTAADGRPVPPTLRQALTAFLTDQGLHVSPGDTEPQLRLHLDLQAADETGTVRLVRVWAAASFAFLENGDTLLSGQVGGSESTASRTLDYSSSRDLAIAKLQPLLLDAVRQAVLEPMPREPGT